MADNEVNKKQINWIMIAAAIGVTAIIGVVGVFAARTIQEKNIHDQKNKQLLDMYKAYIEVLNDNESDIKAYHKNSFAGDGKELEYRLSNNSVKYPCCLHDIDADGIPELMFFTFDDETGCGTINLYSYINNKAQRINDTDGILNYIDSYLGAGTDYVVYTSKKDNYLHIYYLENGEGIGTIYGTYKLTSKDLEKQNEIKIPAFKSEMEMNDDELFYLNEEKIDASEGRKLREEELANVKDILYISNFFYSGSDNEWGNFDKDKSEARTYKEIMNELTARMEKLGHSDSKNEEADHKEIYAAYEAFLKSIEKDMDMDGYDKSVKKAMKKLKEFKKPVNFTDLDNDGIEELLVYQPDGDYLNLRVYCYKKGKVVPVIIEGTGDNILFSIYAIPGIDEFYDAAFFTGDDKVAVVHSGDAYQSIKVYEYDKGKLYKYDTFAYDIFSEDGEYLINGAGIMNEYEQSFWDNGIKKIAEEMGDVLMKYDDEMHFYPAFKKVEKKINSKEEKTMSYDEAYDFLQKRSDN